MRSGDCGVEGNPGAPRGGLSHLTLSVADLDRSIRFYVDALAATVLFHDARIAHLELFGVWTALNVEPAIPRGEIWQSYTHVAFSVSEAQLDALAARMQAHGIVEQPGRQREVGEARSIYVRDPDGHLLELHTGSREQRLAFMRGLATEETAAARDA